MKKISVVIPCYNEQEVLNLYYMEMKRVMDEMDAVFELLFVDDGSTDRTLAILRELHRLDKRCKYVSFSRNFGKEAALYAGMKQADGDYVVVMDVDLQDPPDYLPKMYEMLCKGECECVAAKRMDRTGEKRIRSFFSSMFYKVVNTVSKIKIEEGARDFRMMSRKMVDAILSMSEVNRFSKGMFGWVGFQTEWIPYHNVERAAGNTKWSFLKLIRYSADGIMGFSTLPLSLASYGGILFCGVSFLVISILVIKNLFWHDPVAGWPAMMCVILFIGGVQLFCMGILGQYIARIFIETKHRPVYLLKETSDERENKEVSAAAAVDTCTGRTVPITKIRRISGGF